MAHGSIDDLATLSELDENSLMEELQARYKKDIIYVMKSYLHIQKHYIICTVVRSILAKHVKADNIY